MRVSSLRTTVFISLLSIYGAVEIASLQAQQPAAAQGQGAGPGAQGGGGGRQGGGGGGGRQGGGRGNQPPAAPAPRNAQGRAILGGATPADAKGVWTPNGVGLQTPLAPRDTTPFQAWAAALYDDRQKHELEPHARCKPSGVSRQFLTPYGVEFVERPDIQQMFIFDIGGPHTFRTIYMDGRPHPANFQPTYYGHSTGKWEGDTLVVDTVGFNETFWLDRRGMPHTEKLHTVERFTRIDYNTIRYEATIDDPGAYTAPWTGGFTLRFNPDVELFEYVCQQSNYAGELMVGDFGTVDRTSPIVP